MNWRLPWGLWVAFGVLAIPAFAAPSVQLREIDLAEADGVTRLEIALSESTGIQAFLLDAPKRVVLDLDRTAAPRTRALPAPTGAVSAVRSGAQPGGKLRLVFEMRPEIAIDPAALRRLKQADRISLEWGRSTTPAVPTPPSTPPSTVTALQATKTVAGSPWRGKDVIVAIDAGHGGQDPGAIGPAGTREKDVVLDISRRLAERINREPGMRAVLTREGDYFLSLRQRIKRAREAGALLFVSVHADAVRDRSVSGSSVYVLSDKGATDEQARWLADRENAADLVGGVSLDDKDPLIASVLVDLAQSAQIGQSMIAAERVLRSLASVNEVRKRSVQQAGFVVLKSPDIPSMLVETAFISSPSDEQLLKRKDKRDALAEAIFTGVRQYFVDHPPDGSRFAETHTRDETVVATAAEAARPPTGKL